MKPGTNSIEFHVKFNQPNNVDYILCDKLTDERVDAVDGPDCCLGHPVVRWEPISIDRMAERPRRHPVSTLTSPATTPLGRPSNETTPTH